MILIFGEFQYEGAFNRGKNIFDTYFHKFPSMNSYTYYIKTNARTHTHTHTYTHIHAHLQVLQL